MNVIKKFVTKTFIKNNNLKIIKRYFKHFKYFDEIDMTKFIKEEHKEDFKNRVLIDESPIFKKSEIDCTKGAIFKEIQIEENSKMTKIDFRIYLKNLTMKHKIVAIVNGNPKFPECPESYGILSFLQSFETPKPYVYINANSTKYLKEIFLKKEINEFDPMLFEEGGFEGNLNQLEFFLTFEINAPLNIIEEIQENLEERKANDLPPLSAEEIKIYSLQNMMGDFEGERLVLKNLEGENYEESDDDEVIEEYGLKRKFENYEREQINKYSEKENEGGDEDMKVEMGEDQENLNLKIKKRENLKEQMELEDYEDFDLEDDELNEVFKEVEDKNNDFDFEDKK